MDGVVEIKPENGSKVVAVRAGQKAVITKEGEVEELSTFNPSELDRWWEVVRP